jgi:hypothetical protein
MPQFYNALFTHPTMQHVTLARSRLPRLHSRLGAHDNAAARPFTAGSISLVDCALTSKSIHALAIRLRNSTTVKSLTVSENASIDIDGVRALAQALPTTQLRHLTISHIPLSDGALNVLCTGVAATCSLQTLTLRHVACRGDSFSLVATHLPRMLQL